MANLKQTALALTQLIDELLEVVRILTKSELRSARFANPDRFGVAQSCGVIACVLSAGWLDFVEESACARCELALRRPDRDAYMHRPQ
jgi:hypothetical protein